MSTTFIDLTNDVLTEMREDTVANITDTTYSALIGGFVNRAKIIVQAAHCWSDLRETYVLPTTPSQSTYSLTGVGSTPILLDALNATANGPLKQIGQKELNRLVEYMTASPGAPNKFRFQKSDAQGDKTVELFPTPDAAYSCLFDMVVYEPRLSSNTDATVLDRESIVALAVAFAIRERGETGGTTVQEQLAIAKQIRDDAISLDRALYPEEGFFEVE